MIRASFSGRYPALSRWRLAMLGLGAGYVISPIDAVPEAFLAVFGLADDLVLSVMIATSLLREADDFLAWEEARRRYVSP
jgi:uncharacterized membrane protein YkvA (DUF1232 family)